MEFPTSNQVKAQRRVRKKATFYKHLSIFLIVNGFFFVSFLFNGHPLKPLGITFFWGIGLLLHYLKVFGIPGNGLLSKNWEEKEYEKELKRLEEKREGVPVERLDLREISKKYKDSDLV